MTYVLLLTLIGSPISQGSGSSSQSAPVFYAHETCEMAKENWLAQFKDQRQVKAYAICAPRSVSDYGSITLDKKQ
ncbi:hypothetical protein [Pantoea phage Nafs113]|nr:hypothetical protein [Pantoea phage Nafs113]